MQVLAMLLNHDNEYLVQNVLWILRNLSDVANKQVPLLSLSLDTAVLTPVYPGRVCQVVYFTSLQTTQRDISLKYLRYLTELINQNTL